MNLAAAPRIGTLALGCLALAFSSGACAAGENVAVATAAQEAVTASSGPALWQISDDDTTIYLFGTVHALPEEVKWFSGQIESAFDSSNELVTEVATADSGAIQQQIAAKGLLQSGQNLREMMTPTDRMAYEAALISLGLPVEAFDKFEPWFASLNLAILPLLKEGYSPVSGVESVLNDNAGDKQRAELESVDFQIDIFDGLPMDEQLAYLRTTVTNIPKMKESLDAMVKEWLEGDAKALAKLMNADMADPKLYNRLLLARNANWAHWLADRMKQPGTVFVAVGAGHLAGKGSVQDQLKKQGYKVKRVK